MAQEPSKAKRLDRTQATFGEIGVTLVGALIVYLLRGELLEGLIGGIVVCLGGIAGVEMIKRGRLRLLSFGFGRWAQPASSSNLGDLGVLDFERIALTKPSEMSRLAQELQVEMARGHQMMAERAVDVKRRPLGGSFRERERFAKEWAQEIEGNAAKLEALQRRHRAAREQVAASFLGLIEGAPCHPREFWVEGDNSFVSLARQTTEGRAQAVSLRDGLRVARKTNVSQEVNRAVDHMIRVYDSALEDADAILKYCADGRALVARRLAKTTQADQQSHQPTTHDPSPQPPSPESGGKD
jgi:hypothetical protein